MTTTESIVRDLARGIDPASIAVEGLEPWPRVVASAARLLSSSASGDRAHLEGGVRDVRALAAEALKKDAAGLGAVVAAFEDSELVTLEIALSAVLARTGDERALDAAARLGEAALAASAKNSGAALAMRLVRIYEELDRPEAIERAYAEAVRRNPLSAWILPPSMVGPAAERAEEEAIAASEGAPAIVRDAIRALRTGRDRAAAVVRLESEAMRSPEQIAPALLLCVERLRSAAALDPSREAKQLAKLLEEARAYARSLRPLGAVAVLASAMIAVLGGRREEAIDALASGLPHIEEGDARARAAAIADALERELRVPPHKVDEILRRAFFDALIDPLGAFDPPRSAFAQLRHWIAGAALALALTGAATSVAEAQDPAPQDEQTMVDEGGGADEGGGGDEGGGDEGGGADEGGGGGGDEGGGGGDEGGGDDGDDGGGGDGGGGDVDDPPPDGDEPPPEPQPDPNAPRGGQGWGPGGSGRGGWNYGFSW
jgi:hypothetical protein